jgi:acyl-homoserine lactone synthase
MALVIKPQHRDALYRLLDQTYRLRFRTYLKRLGWEVTADSAHPDSDAFDSGACSHIVSLDGQGRVRGALRLTPSVEPNLTNDVLQSYFVTRLPRAPELIEISRFCVCPDLDERDRVTVLDDLFAGRREFCRRQGWRASITVVQAAIIPELARRGFETAVLAGPIRLPSDSRDIFAIRATDNRHGSTETLSAAHRLQDPDEAPHLLVRHSATAG